MTTVEILEILREKLARQGGRHLYAVLGSYAQLDQFARRLHEATTPDGLPFPKPLNVNRGILESLPDDEFKGIVENEMKHPEPTARHVAWGFEKFLRDALLSNGFVVLSNLELVFAYGLDLQPLKTLASDDHRILMLLPAKMEGSRVIVFPNYLDGDYTLPFGLVTESHLWQITD